MLDDPMIRIAAAALVFMLLLIGILEGAYQIP